MSVSIPTTQELSDDIVAAIQASISQSVPFLPKTFTRVLAKVLAGALVLLYKYAGFVLLQMFVAHATDKETTVLGRVVQPLVEWGLLIGVGKPLAATRAEATVTVTVTNQTGQLDGGAQLVRTETQVIYQVVAPVLLNAPTVTATIRAASDPSGGGGAGTFGNLVAGDTLSFANPLPNVATDVTVLAPTVQGADAETPDAYRKRVVERFQARPQGGAYADYRSWGMIAGVVSIYPYASNTPGWVDVYVETATNSDGIPTTPQLEAVYNALLYDEAGNATRKPVNAYVRTLPITRQAFDLYVSNLTPDSQDLRDEIKAGVDEYLRSREPFIEGLSVLPRADRITQAAVSGIVDDIVNAAGATVTTVQINPGPAWTLGHGQKAKLGVDHWL